LTVKSRRARSSAIGAPSSTSGSAEALVQQRLLAQAPRHLGGVALHHQVEVARVAAEQRVAHRAAHDPHPRDVVEGVEELPRAGCLPQPLQQVVVHVPATIAPHVAAG
jgi:hypothetical protein